MQSNDVTSNEVVAFARKSDGTLREVGRYPTGGVGSGSFEDASRGLALGTAEGETSPIQNVDQAELLFAANAGSGTISVFRVNPEGLELVSQVPSGGNRPVSLTVNNGLLYVLNSGEVDQRLVLGPDNLLENCSHGEPPSVSGFRVTGAGFVLGIAVGTPLMAGLIGHRGARSALACSAALVLLGAILAVTAPVLPVLTAAGAVQGLGAAGLATTAMNLATSTRVMGLITAALAVFGATAPLVGSLIGDVLSWQVALALPALSLLAVRRAPTAATARDRFDGKGAALLTAVVTALVFVPQWPVVAGLCAVAAGVLLGFHVRA